VAGHRHRNTSRDIKEAIKIKEDRNECQEFEDWFICDSEFPPQAGNGSDIRRRRQTLDEDESEI
jgi:hypothetical protein